MSEQKYYVNDLLTGDGAWVGKDIFGVVSGGHMKPTAFTKSELAEIKKGAFYKRAPYGEIEETGVRTGWYHVTDDDSFDDEWINPLIELVPVEEVE